MNYSEKIPIFEVLISLGVEKIVDLDPVLQVATERSSLALEAIPCINVSPSLQTLELDFTLQMMWNDYRMALPVECYDPEYLGSYNLDPDVSRHLWVPPLQLESMLYLKIRDSFQYVKGTTQTMR